MSTLVAFVCFFSPVFGVVAMLVAAAVTDDCETNNKEEKK